MPLALLLALVAQTAQLRREMAEIGVVEKLGASLPDVPLTAEDGAPLRVRTGAPLLLSFNYTGCTRLCSLQLGGMASALRAMKWRGEGFSVLSVSIDPHEKPAQLRAYRQQMLREAGGGELPWRFATASPQDVAKLADAVGFRYKFDPATGDFSHQATLIVVASDGRVSSYLNGITYSPDVLRAAIARAAGGRVATADEQSSIKGFVLMCMGFDPKDPAPRALKIMRASGIFVALFFFGFIGVHALRGRHSRGTPSV